MKQQDEYPPPYSADPARPTDPQGLWPQTPGTVPQAANADMDPQIDEYPPPYSAGPVRPTQHQGLGPQYPGPVPVPQQAAPAQVVTNMPSNVCVRSSEILGEFSTAMKCQHCYCNIQTRISHQAGLLTYISAGVICLFGGIFGCCLIPFCLDFCLDVVHSCPNCNQHLGIYQRLD